MLFPQISILKKAAWTSLLLQWTGNCSAPLLHVSPCLQPCWLLLLSKKQIIGLQTFHPLGTFCWPCVIFSWYVESMGEVLAASERNERCLSGEVSNIPQNLVMCSPGNCARSYCFVPATVLSPELLGLVGSVENLCLFPTFSYFLLLLTFFFNHSQTRCLIPFLSQIFSKFQAFQLCVCKLVKNDKIFLLELASSQDDDHYIMRRRFCLSFVQFARQLFCSNIF